MDVYKLRKILQRYREGGANETESALVEAWYRSYEQQEQPLANEDMEEIRLAVKSKVRTATKKSSIFQMPLFRIAACFTIFFFLGFFAWKLHRHSKPVHPDYTAITTGTGQLKQLSLPDGSVIWVNAASRLKAPIALTGKYREVILEEGEAFFDIKHDNSHPFIVHASLLNVQVLGTSFNIRAYKGMNAITVSVATGKVGVTGKAKTIAMLIPGQRLYYNTLNGATEQKDFDLGHAQSWTKGYTYLEQAGFKELATIVKNIYGVSIKAGNNKVKNYRFTLRLMHNLPTHQVLGLISRLHHTHFRKEGNDIILY